MFAVTTNDNAPACTATKCELAAPEGGCKCGGNLCSEGSYCYTTMSRCESFESCSNIVYEKEGKTVQASVISTANSLERMISLKAGWNLISQPFTEFVTTTNCVPKRIYAFDADAQNYAWIGSFGEMSGGRGYFVQVDSDCYIRFVGSQKASSIKLKSGWNLVGTAFNKEMSLNDVNRYCTPSATIWGFGTSVYAAASTLTPGMGYFVKYSGTADNSECTVYSADTDSSASTTTTTTTTIPTLNGGQCPANCGGFVGSCQCGTFTCVSGNGLANSYCCPATAGGTPMCYASQSYCTSVCPASSSTTTTTTAPSSSSTTTTTAAPVTTSTTTTSTTFTTTTTTTLPNCDGSCGTLAPAGGCKCGTSTCSSGRYCCVSKNSCYAGPDACAASCFATTTTTTLPSCAYTGCEVINAAACACGTATCSAGRFCCSANNACSDTYLGCNVLCWS